ncbi:hypothetical protein PHYPSEUDO_014622 [Phytophthora pseudosyringae]|uniref:Uncharacterized protein n=1 Tax=Phytophthora pseudosyringae TaxID=221518 RepID=A0A8T1V4S3_9STRA|nr:hypothetical protein PHYPSEUDO_014622 [Phytophthora pseudosyringae]
MIQLVDSVLTSKPPWLTNETTCIQCQSEDALSAVIPGVDAYRRPAPGASPPTTAVCGGCGATYKDKDIIDASLIALAHSDFDVMDLQWNDFEKCRPPQVRENNSVATSLLVRDLQVHYWNHCKSCFKVSIHWFGLRGVESQSSNHIVYVLLHFAMQKTIRTPKASICRFLKPESVHLGRSIIDEHQCLHLHRSIGCEYVNAYNPIVMAAMKCNHDAQFVLSNGAKDTAAYVATYCFKSQNPVENQIALSLAAFTKAVAKTHALPPDTSAIDRGYKILGSMLYTVTNGQEVVAPMAALYILNETPFWFSHEFVRVDMWRMLQKRSGLVEISVSQHEFDHQHSSQGSISSDNLLKKYWKRKAAFEHVSFIDILEQFE